MCVCTWMDTDTGPETRTHIPTHIYLYTYMHSIGLSIIKTFTLHSIYPLSSTFKAMQSVRKNWIGILFCLLDMHS